MSFRVGSGAREDVAEIAEFMDLKTDGRGEVFIAAVERAYALIESGPRMQPLTEDGPPSVETRYHMIDGFRYRVVFAIVVDDVYVLAVGHVHRRPNFWHHRLTTEI
jgi:toxin ParE2